MGRPKLLVQYHMIPEEERQFIVSENDPNYENWEQAHGCYINYTDDIPEEIYNLISLINVNDLNNPDQEPPLLLEGKFKIIHCGFIL